MFDELIAKGRRLGRGTMTFDEFLALSPYDRSGIAGCAAGELAARDPKAAFELLSGLMQESKGEA